MIGRHEVLERAAPGATVLLNTPYPAGEVWDSLPREAQEQILAKAITLYAIDGAKVARDAGLGGRVNTVLQTCFFAISGVMPREEAIKAIKAAIAKTYGRRGPEVVARNDAAVDASLAALHQVENPGRVTVTRTVPPVVPAHAPEFVQAVTAQMMAGRGDELPVSALPVDGTYPLGTAAYEKRNISEEVAAWDPDLCIQCGNCSFVCPHSVIRSKFYDVSLLAEAPDGFPVMALDARGLPDARYSLQVYAEDCTGCGLCVEACPASAPGDPGHKAINLAPREPLVDTARHNIAFFETIPVNDRSRVDFGTVRGAQFLQPLFEFSGACAGCGETPYIKLVSQLFGDRLMVANANRLLVDLRRQPANHPWTTDKDGRGPAWANSLFEDNAEFGLGFRLAADQHLALARRRLAELKDALGPGGADLAEAILTAPQRREAEYAAQRERVTELKRRLAQLDEGRTGRGGPEQRGRSPVRRSVWTIGGDGWAYDTAPAGSITCWPAARRQRAGAGRRLTPIPAGRRRSRRRSVGRKFAAAGQSVPKKHHRAGDRLRQRLRGPRGDGRELEADAAGVPRGRGQPGHLAGDRLQRLHRATASRRTRRRCATGWTSSTAPWPVATAR